MLRGSIPLLLPALSLERNSNTLARGGGDQDRDFIILSQTVGDTSQLHVGAGGGDTKLPDTLDRAPIN